MARGKKRDYAVGYCKPPVRTRFKPGWSGNPNGRPKGSKGFTALLAEELNGRITVTEDGRKKTMTKGQALVKSLVNGGLKGEVRKIGMIATLSRAGQGQGSPEPDPSLSPQDEALLLGLLADLPRVKPRRRAAKQPRKSKRRAALQRKSK